jgi:hypothetical protein
MDELKSIDDLTPELKPVNRRLVMAGFAGVGAAALIGGKLTSVQAQDSDDDDDDDDSDDDDYGTTMDPELEAKLLALYDVFLGSVATELGVADTASIDLAIRNGMKAVVDQRFADGEISANRADERKAAIEAAVVPMCIGGRGLGDRMRDRRDGREWDDDDDSDDGDDSDDDATPTT